MADYFVLAKIKVDASGVQQEINNLVKNTEFNVKANVSGGKEMQKMLEITREIKTNALEGFRGRNLQAFNDPGVTAQYEKVLDLIDSYKGGKKASAELKNETIKLHNAVAEVKREDSAAATEKRKLTQETERAAKASEKETKNMEIARLSRKKMMDNLENLKNKNETIFREDSSIKSQYEEVKRLIGAYDKSEIAMKEIDVANNKLKQSVRNLNGAVKETSQDIGTKLVNSIGTAIVKMALWGIAADMIYGNLQKIREGVQFIKDLNKEMVNLSFVTGQSVQSMAPIAEEYNNIAQDLGVSTLEVAQGGLAWQRQGKSTEETMLLLTNSTKLAKLGNMEAADATEKLTSILNAYNLTAEDSLAVIGTLIQLDNNFATSTKEIAEALSQSSSVAQAAKVDFENLASYITVVSSITRDSGDKIGNSFRSIISRMQQVKAGVNFDEQGESLNNVEKVLKKYDIALRDSTHTFRDLDDVIADAAEKYQELGRAGDTVGQSMITTALAGQWQRNTLTALFMNWGDVTKAQTLAADNLEIVDDRYTEYLEGIEGSSNRLKSIWDELWIKMFPPETISRLNNEMALFLKSLSESASISDRMIIAGMRAGDEESFKNVQRLSEETKKSFLELEELKKSVGAEADLKIIEAIKEADIPSALSDVDEAMREHRDVVNNAQEASEAYVGAAAEIPPTLEELADAAKTASDEFMSANATLESIMSDYEKYGQISMEQAQKLIEAGYARGVQINSETGAITLNTSAIRIQSMANAEAAMQKAKANYETLKSVDALSKETAAAYKSYQMYAAILALFKKSSSMSFVGSPASSAGGGGSTYSGKDAYDDLLKITVDMLKQQAKDQKDALKEQLDAYKDIIDAQKEKLDLMKEEQDYLDDIAEKNKDLADIDNELLQLQFDNSEEAKARKLELLDERIDAEKDLEDTQNDYSIDQQKNALDQEYEDYKANIDAKIDELDRYLSHTGEITQQAMALIEARSASFYNALIDYNNMYGDGVNATIDKMWNLADAQAVVVSGYGAIAAAQAKLTPTGNQSTIGQSYGYGALVGLNEIAARGYSEGGSGIVPEGYENDTYPIRLSSGEGFEVFTKQQMSMMGKANQTNSKPISTLSNRSGDGGINIGDIVFQVQGNMDKALIPDVEEAALRGINRALAIRGVRRNATSMQI